MGALTVQGTFNPGQQVAEDVLQTAVKEAFTGRIDLTSATGDAASLLRELSAPNRGTHPE